MRQEAFASITFKNSYEKLPDCFYERIDPVPVKAPKIIKFNQNLALELGLDTEMLQSQKGAEFFSGNFLAYGSNPIALAYAGHQFGNFVPRLGDGRAVLLGEICNKNGKCFDLQLKGSGKTSFSRRGDGRAALGPIIREYILSEAIHKLGIKTTRSLAFVSTGEPVFRETIMPGGIITRVASSHIRVGTFEYFAAKGDIESVKLLADYTIKRHYLECKSEDNPYISLLEKVSESQASLIASWMGVGFIHGVMNTDNTSISGETIDYGPCAFMDEYDPNIVFSSIDINGRYAYINQPYIGQWNLARFAQAILPLLDQNIDNAVDIAEKIVADFNIIYQEKWLQVMSKKIGIAKPESQDYKLIQDFLNIIQKERLDFTNSFRKLVTLLNNEDGCEPVFDNWSKNWRKRLNKDKNDKEFQTELMNSSNPAYIPRNHQVEKAIKFAVDEGDFSAMENLIEVLDSPYKYENKYKSYTNIPKPEERVKETFCGT